eukprot:15482439-Alexandrium_andersonii.AAC.1
MCIRDRTPPTRPSEPRQRATRQRGEWPADGHLDVSCLPPQPTHGTSHIHHDQVCTLPCTCGQQVGAKAFPGTSQAGPPIALSTSDASVQTKTPHHGVLLAA